MPITDPTAAAPARRNGAILTSLFLILAFAGAAAGAQSVPPALQGPDADEDSAPTATYLTAVEPEFDFGTLVKGEPAVHTFVLRNTGETPVTIDRLVPHGCTIVEYDETIPPGGEGKVRAELETLALNGVGTSVIHILVEGNEGPAARLELHFNVVAKVLARPGRARWLYVQHEEEGTISQTVYSADGADFEIVEVESPMPAIEVTYREAEPDERVARYEGSQWVVEPTLDSQAPIGPITGLITVRTTHPDQRVLQIPVSGFVRPALFVEPQEGDFGTVELSERTEASFHVRNFATDPITLKAADTNVPGISARVQPVQEGRRYDVILELDPAEMEEGRFDGELTIETDSEKIPVLKVDLSGTLVRRPADESEGPAG